MRHFLLTASALVVTLAFSMSPAEAHGPQGGFGRSGYGSYGRSYPCYSSSYCSPWYCSPCYACSYCPPCYYAPSYYPPSYYPPSYYGHGYYGNSYSFGRSGSGMFPTGSRR